MTIEAIPPQENCGSPMKYLSELFRFILQGHCGDLGIYAPEVRVNALEKLSIDTFMGREFGMIPTQSGNVATRAPFNHRSLARLEGDFHNPSW